MREVKPTSGWGIFEFRHVITIPEGQEGAIDWSQQIKLEDEIFG